MPQGEAKMQHGHTQGHDDHDHHDHHDHHHGAGGHSHAPVNFGNAFAIGMVLNLGYVIGEAFYGVAGHSLALLADAGHNLGDVLGLAAAWLAAWLGQKHPGGRYTYGLRRASILSALGNAVLLLLVTGGIAWEAVLRLIAPGAPGGAVIMVVAAIGIAVNGGTALLFMSGRKGDLNVRAAFTHMLADAAVAAGTVAAGALILWTGWNRVDPAVSLVIGVVIIAGTWSLLRDSIKLSLDAVPDGIEPSAVESFLLGLPGVVAIHDVHIWGLSTTDVALTAHLVCHEEAAGQGLLVYIAEEMREHFGIGHATIQLETPAVAEICCLRPDHVI